MARRYITVDHDTGPLAIGDYLLSAKEIGEETEDGEREILLVITDTRIKGPERSKARYLATGEAVEIDRELSVRFFVGGNGQTRGMIEAPAQWLLRRVKLRPANLGQAE
ncbi:hypothetical protein CAI21_18555 [Alkalilimnicola ehrlichii]|uniref:Uncharacterized protein n=1 Tax=Alkalilimnicola ehrlichii TaxID=351052 RepID=A0A3E0WL82_9GAMM|nr:hypothetical protein [Alkalilimnicola ehrlichii]RFA25766.1 hypothetical protein CAI21_18555 [Alkalilimnicola ehrlichii]RFA32847.1 hypothetical protein CAL65_18810 [Alkalilimnicola ehrlichii]